MLDLVGPPMVKKRGGSIPSGSGREDDGKRARIVTWGGREGVTWGGREAERWGSPETRVSEGVDAEEGARGSQERSGRVSSEEALSAKIWRPVRRMYAGKSMRKDTLRVRRELARRNPSKSGQGRVVTSLPALSK